MRSINSLPATICIVFTFAFGSQALATDAGEEVLSFYRKSPTWQETMVHSRQALREERAQAAGSTKIYLSPVMRGGDAAIQVEVSVAGWRDLYLIVQDEGDYHHDVANWGEAKLVDSAGDTLFLDLMEPNSA